MAIALLLVLYFSATPVYTYTTVRTVTVQVTDKERITTGGKNPQSYWLVFTKDHDVFKNADSWLWLKFNSSSIQGKLERGKIYTLKVCGLRIELLSMYPNIVKIVSEVK